MKSDSSGTAGRMDDAAHHAIKGFTLEGLLGQGGMGLVYRATQHRPRRPVALKLLRPTAVSQRSMRRFEREAEILARLQHPSIARVYEAGVIDADPASQPTPYFAMELIDGMELGRYAEAASVPTEDRIKLFITICDAVHYAHKQGVIHRDLKPANILVDQSGQAKVLDFGIARVTGSDQTLTTMQTDVGQLLGTLAYMSPEQVVGDPASVDARSDVYALGVTLYELLCGHLPYTIHARSLPEAARVIQEQEPAPLSSHDRTMRGDIETIVGRCLEKEPHRRYASAEALAQDLRRYLASRPIEARPPSGWYQATRFAKRNKTLVAGLAAVFVTLVLGMVGTSLGLSQAVESQRREAKERAEADGQRLEAQAAARRAEASESAMAMALEDEKRMRELAQEESRRANNTSKLYVDMIDSIEPAVARGKDITLLARVLKTGDQLADERLKEHPEDESRLRYEIAQSYLALGAYEDANEQARLAYELATHSYGPAATHTQDCLLRLAETYFRKGNFQQSLQLKQKATASIRRVVNIESKQFFTANQRLGQDYQRLQRWEEDRATNEMLIALARFIPELPQKLVTNLSDAKSVYLLEMGQYHEAFIILDRLYKDRIKNLGPTHPETLHTLGNYAWSLIETGNPTSAAEKLMQALPIVESVYREEPKQVLNIKRVLSIAYDRSGRLDLAIPLQQELVAEHQSILGTKHPETSLMRHFLGMSLMAANRHEDARDAFIAGYQGFNEVLGPKHSQTLNCAHELGRVLARLQEYKEAEKYIQIYIDIASSEWGKDTISVMLGRESLAECVYESGDYPRALNIAESIYEDAIDVFGSGHIYVARLSIFYAQCLIKNKKYRKAEKILLNALTTLPSAKDTTAYERIRAAHTLADVYIAIDQKERAKYWTDHGNNLIRAIKEAGLSVE